MTNSFPNNAEHFSAFQSSLCEATENERTRAESHQLEADRHFATTAERQVLALEMIADQLQMIVRALTVLTGDGSVQEEATVSGPSHQ